MAIATRIAQQGGADVQSKSAENAQDKAGGRSVQLKQSLVGMDFASQEAALAPESDVQMKEAGGGHGGQVQMEGGGATSVAPSPEQLVQDAFTLGGTSRYQVTPEEAMKWLEERKEHAPPEHRYAFQQAILKVNKRL